MVAYLPYADKRDSRYLVVEPQQAGKQITTKVLREMNITLKTYLTTIVIGFVVLILGSFAASQAVASVQNEAPEFMQQLSGEKEPDLIALASATTTDSGRGAEAVKADCDNADTCVGRFQAY